MDLTEYDDYLEKVPTPMDLSTIKEQLASDYYDNPKDLNKDLRLIFQNSKIYNTDKRSAIYSMTLRLQALVNEQMKKILKNYKREQTLLETKKKRSGNQLTNSRTRKRKLEESEFEMEESESQEDETKEGEKTEDCLTNYRQLIKTGPTASKIPAKYYRRSRLN